MNACSKAQMWNQWTSMSFKFTITKIIPKQDCGMHHWNAPPLVFTVWLPNPPLPLAVCCSAAYCALQQNSSPFCSVPAVLSPLFLPLFCEDVRGDVTNHRKAKWLWNKSRPSFANVSSEPSYHNLSGWAEAACCGLSWTCWNYCTRRKFKPFSFILSGGPPNRVRLTWQCDL